jgi:Fe-S oxidoreductase
VLAQPLLEPAWTREDAVCCGGGGVLPFLKPEVAAGAARQRMAQLQATGAERVVTACPGCVRMLSGVEGGLPVADLSEILAEAFLPER